MESKPRRDRLGRISSNWKRKRNAEEAAQREAVDVVDGIDVIDRSERGIGHFTCKRGMGNLINDMNRIPYTEYCILNSFLELWKGRASRMILYQRGTTPPFIFLRWQEAIVSWRVAFYGIQQTAQVCHPVRWWKEKGPRQSTYSPSLHFFHGGSTEAHMDIWGQHTDIDMWHVIILGHIKVIIILRVT